MMEYQLKQFKIDFADTAHVAYGAMEDVPDELFLDVLQCMKLVKTWSKDKTSDLFGREDVLGSLLPSFFRCMFRFKHEGFKEEKEVRLVCGVPDLVGRKLEEDDSRPAKDIKFYEGSEGYVPYIEIKTKSGILPIKKIIVGPSRNSGRRQESIQLMLANRGMETDMVELTKIPYREKY